MFAPPHYMLFRVNQIIGWTSDPDDEDTQAPSSGESKPERAERVLYIPSPSEMLVIDIFSPKGVPIRVLQSQYANAISQGLRCIWSIDPYDYFQLPDSDYSKFQLSSRDKNWELIKDIADNPKVFDDSTRVILLREAARKAKRPISEAYRCLRLFFQRGQVPNALVIDQRRAGGRGSKQKSGTNKRGRLSEAERDAGYRIGGIVIGPEERKRIQAGLREFRMKCKLSLTEAYDRTVGKYWNCGKKYENGVYIPVLMPEEQYPTEAQFRRVWDEMRRSDPEKTAVAKYGQKKVNLRIRPTLGDESRASFGPYSIFQIDAHTCDFHLVSRRTRKAIGRPTLYRVVSQFTHGVFGFAVTLEAPSYIGAALALENAFLSKADFFNQIGMDIPEEEWPCEGKCHGLVADRGELLGPMANTLAHSLNIRLENLPPYRADLKGIVENSFRLNNDRLRRLLPGAIDPHSERGDADPILQAALDIEQFTKIQALLTVEHNQRVMTGYRLNEYMVADGVVATPNDLLVWGLSQGLGLPRPAPSREVLRACLLPRRTGVITGSGLCVRGVHYVCQRALDEGWFLDDGETRVNPKVLFDPRLVDTVHLRRPHSPKTEICHLTPADNHYAGMSWNEVAKHVKQRRSDERQTAHMRRQRRLDHTSRYEGIVDMARKRTNEATDPNASKSSRRAGRAEARQAERTEDRQLAWTSGTSFDAATNNAPELQTSAPSETLALPASSAPNPDLAPPKQSIPLYEMLRKLRDDRRNNDGKLNPHAIFRPVA